MYKCHSLSAFYSKSLDIDLHEVINDAATSMCSSKLSSCSLIRSIKDGNGIMLVKCLGNSSYINN
jgi:hypothetical protein